MRRGDNRKILIAGELHRQLCTTQLLRTFALLIPHPPSTPMTPSLLASTLTTLRSVASACPFEFLFLLIAPAIASRIACWPFLELGDAPRHAQFSTAYANGRNERKQCRGMNMQRSYLPEMDNLPGRT